MESNIELVQVGDMARRPISEEIIPGLLDDGVVLIVAKEGTGKTFLGVSMGVHVAGGVPWNRKPVKKGMVVYCIAEGASFFTYRVTTACDAFKVRASEIPFYVLDGSINLRSNEKGEKNPDVLALLKSIRDLEVKAEQQCRLLIFDTLSRCMPGGDENDQRDAGELIHGVEFLRHELGCGIVLMHHMRKGGDLVRGSTVLTAAADEVIVCKSDPEETLQLWTTKDGGKRKDRDGIEQWTEKVLVGMTDGEMTVRCEEEEETLVKSDHVIWVEGYNEDGSLSDEPISQTIPVLKPIEAPAEGCGPLSPSATAVLACLREHGELGVTALMRHTGKAQKTVYNAIDRLIELGHVEKNEDTKRFKLSGMGTSPFGG